MVLSELQYNPASLHRLPYLEHPEYSKRLLLKNKCITLAWPIASQTNGLLVSLALYMRDHENSNNVDHLEF